MGFYREHPHQVSCSPFIYQQQIKEIDVSTSVVQSFDCRFQGMIELATGSRFWQSTELQKSKIKLRK